MLGARVRAPSTLTRLLCLSDSNGLIAGVADSPLRSGRINVRGEHGHWADVDTTDVRRELRGDPDVGVIQDVDVADGDVHEPVLLRIVLGCRRPRDSEADRRR